MIDFTVNRKKRRYRGPAFKRLLDVLREDFGLTGTKEGCGEGECGACTVLLDGAPVNACLVPVVHAQGAHVETVESLGAVVRLSPLQEAFLDRGAAQCGICTPGMLMTAVAHLRSGGGEDSNSVRLALAGNLCRCTGYQHIVDAVVDAARRERKRRSRAR
jgi:carbon-monoxide dehydrogenase small subunit